MISPIAKLEIIEAAHALDKPVMLGAYTPTEAQLAHEACAKRSFARHSSARTFRPAASAATASATAVVAASNDRFFPADKLGPSDIKNIRAPLPHLRIVPTGGVDLQTAPEFLKAGCAALGVGSSLLTAEILKTKNWPELTRLAAQFVEVVARTRAA